jgi:colanic acid biosynthesis glycosyl transferase WcaI
MRLLVVTQYFWPENFRINDLVAELVRRGHDVTVLTGKPNYPDGSIFVEFLESPSSFDLYEGATVVRVPMLGRGQGNVRLILNYFTFALSASCLGPWKLRKRRFDVIFTCQLSPVTVGIPAAVMRMVKKVPMAFWILDLWPETLRAMGVIRSEFMLAALGRMVSLIYRHCDLILAQSRRFVPAIKKYARQNAQIEYFPSWAESVFSLQDVLDAPEIPRKTGSFNVMFAGNIGDAQDFPAILDAAEMLKHQENIRWLIVGDGRMASWVAHEIRSRGLQDSMLVLGRYPVERMPSFFKHADALLVSLKDEPIFELTIPGKLQSYLASGIPVLAMLNGEGAAVVTNRRAGLAARAGDHKALAEAILKLSAMPIDERKAMGMRGLALSREEFGRENLIDQLEYWLEDLRFHGRHVVTKRGN